MAERQGPKVYSIAAHRGFADALVAGLVPRYANDEFGLARLTLLVPSSRARRTISEAQPGSAHNIGTCRMSANPAEGVVNKWGQSHDIDNLFVSDGSQFTSNNTGNPTLTIVALAIRQAEYIAEQMRTNEF